MTIPPGGLQGLASRPQTDNLEELWMDDLKCQSKHIHPENKLCTVKATHIITLVCSVPPPGLLLCDGATRYAVYWLDADRTVCETCRRPVNDCWKLRPL